MASLSDTFLAAVRSVATAATLASSGIYLHRKKLVTSEGKKALTTLSHQIAIPALFFSKIIHCPQDQKKEQCPDVLQHLPDVWLLLLWPAYVVGCGLVVGEIVATLSNTPPSQRMMVRVACAFANSNALPITLLAVIHSNVAVADVGQVDPNLFLSIYLIVYPVILWSLGTWLLSENKSSSTDKIPNHNNDHREGDREDLRGNSYFSLSPNTVAGTTSDVSDLGGPTYLASDYVRNRQSEAKNDDENISLLQRNHDENFEVIEQDAEPVFNLPLVSPEFTETCKAGLLEALHPPSVGALLGIFVASIRPLRALFVDLDNRNGDAPFQWLFDGIYAVSFSSISVCRNMLIILLKCL